MKKITIVLFLALTTLLTTTAQTREQDKQLKSMADEYYRDEQYNLAIQYYQELATLSDQNAGINYQLAESYRKTFKYAEAEGYYLKTHFQAANQFPLALYYYALMLKRNGEFDESILYFSEFISACQGAVNLNDYELKDFMEQALIDKAGSEMAKAELSKKSATYPFKLEDVNSRFNDYAPTVFDSTTLVITSGRVESNRAVIDERYGEAFADNFYFTKNGNHWQDKTKQMFSITNSRFNDGSGCFNHQGNKYYFTICGNESAQCRIFLSTLKDGKWTQPVVLNDNINSGTFESKHPAISKGGDTLLFSSNRRGGFGKYDIWMSINAGSENWGPAINMGSIVNTKLNEFSPSFTEFQNVFFLCSDGHQNYGGLDLYMAKRFSNGVIALYNLDYPFNSTYDDCFISFAAQKIYISSNRKGGLGGFDIYSIKVPSLISYMSKLSLKNKDARGDVKLNARTEKVNNLDLLTARNEDRIEYENLTYEKKKIVDKIVANQLKSIAKTRSEFKNISDEEYESLVGISKMQYGTHDVKRRFAQTMLTEIDLPSDTSKEVSIRGILRDSVSGKPLSSTKILLINGAGDIIKTSSTNDLGQFRFANISSNHRLYLRLEKSSDFRMEKPMIDNLNIITVENQSVYSFENIYFDFDQYILRPEAKLVLNDLVNFLHHNPAKQVEIYAYADDRGEDGYNLILTQKRGEAVLQYLTSNGVDQTSIVVTARGRQKEAVKHIELQRQFNRRVEFYLNGEKVGAEQMAKTYILKEKSDWISLSSSTGVNVDDLKKLNGASGNELQIYQPVRIPMNAKKIPEALFFAIR